MQGERPSLFASLTYISDVNTIATLLHPRRLLRKHANRTRRNSQDEASRHWQLGADGGSIRRPTDYPTR